MAKRAQRKSTGIVSSNAVARHNRHRRILDSQAYRHHDMTSIKPFHVDIPDEALERIRARVAGYPWHEMPDDGGWDYGTNLDYMKELCAYWVEEFDWRKQEAAINRFSHFMAPVDGIDIHFIHEKGSGPAPF
jgi:microsomal epoxide hydrolase